MSLYQSFGVGAAEVEVDCVTGERRLLRADIMFDAGRSVSPAIDMGQVSNGPSACLHCAVTLFVTQNYYYFC
jgi:xanthine dehydrogenase molybdopterin-binding subunit B